MTKIKQFLKKQAVSLSDSALNLAFLCAIPLLPYPLLPLQVL